jgi:hypothetical protein
VEVLRFEGDDPFLSEVRLWFSLGHCLTEIYQLSTFIDVIEHGPQASEILSSFEGEWKSPLCLDQGGFGGTHSIIQMPARHMS